MSWENKYKDNDNKEVPWINFEKDKVWDCTYLGFTEKPNEFPNAQPGEMLEVYKLEIDGKIKVLTSSSRGLRENLKPLPEGAKVRIHCIMKNGKRMYDVDVWKDE